MAVCLKSRCSVLDSLLLLLVHAFYQASGIRAPLMADKQSRIKQGQGRSEVEPAVTRHTTKAMPAVWLGKDIYLAIQFTKKNKFSIGFEVDEFLR